MRARSKFGIAIAAMMRMMAITISNSISENPRVRRPDALISWLSSIDGLDGSILWSKKQKGGSGGFLPSWAELLLQRRKAGTSARRSDYNAGCVYANDSSFVDAICRRTRRVQRHRRGADRKAGVTRHTASGRNSGSERKSAVGCECERITTLLVRSRRQNFIDQARILTTLRTSRTAQLRQRQRVAVAESGREGFLGGRNRAERSDCRSLVRSNFGAKQVGNRDGRDDQNDRHDDQQLDKRKALLFLVHCFSLKQISVL